MRTEPIAELDPGLLEEAEQRKVLSPGAYEGLEYRRANNDVKDLARGTILVGGRVVPSYPHIGRVVALAPGIRKNLQGRFRLEEKMDGYNVRVVRIDGRILPFTRGGFVCPFTVDRLGDLADLEPFFDAHPDLVVCCEISGRKVPYTASESKRVSDDVELHAFDLMRLDTNGFLPLEEVDARLEAHGIPRTEILGYFEPDDIDAIRDVILDLDERGSEGMVIKPLSSDGRRVKYVTPSTNLLDITSDVHLLAEQSGVTLTHRLFRLAVGIDELGLQDRLPKLENVLGHALLGGFMDTIEAVKSGQNVHERRTLRLKSPEAADRFENHFSRIARSVRMKEIERRTEGEYTTVELEKTFPSSSDRIRALLEGNYVID